MAGTTQQQIQLQAQQFFAAARVALNRGDYDEYARNIQLGYRLKPSNNVPAFPQDGAAISRDQLLKLREKARALIDRGVIFSPTIAALAYAEAKLGDKAAVGRLADYDHFFKVQSSVAPDFAGGRFFETLADEVRSKLNYYGVPSNRERTIHNAWRHEAIFDLQRPAVQALKKELYRRVDQYVAELPKDSDHPFIASRPREYKLEGWAVVSKDEGHHGAHIHPRAWIEGVYYILQPDTADDSEPDAGHLKVGPPLGVTPESGWPERSVAPVPGTLVLMPGYFYHASRPTRVEQERMCIAFDVTPIELVHAR
ncbi:MAG: putative 2OG-Fe(II) oxygenase [Pseudolabrys sp.]